jgi:hypothetical protein
MEIFKVVWSNVDDVCSGGPSTVTRVGVKKQFNNCIRDNQRISNDETAPNTSIGHEEKSARITLVPTEYNHCTRIRNFVALSQI